MNLFMCGHIFGLGVEHLFWSTFPCSQGIMPNVPLISTALDHVLGGKNVC